MAQCPSGIFFEPTEGTEKIVWKELSDETGVVLAKTEFVETNLGDLVFKEDGCFFSTY
jgi:hypothetical protein